MKVLITKHFLLPGAFKNLNQKIDDFIIDEKALSNVITKINEKNTDRSGVRDIKHFINSLVSKLSLLRMHALFLYSSSLDSNKDSPCCFDDIDKESFLPKEEKKILSKILKSTPEEIFKEDKIFVSTETLMLLKKHLVPVDNSLSMLDKYMYT